MAAALVIGLGLLALTLFSPAAPSAIEFDAPVFDAGVVWAGELIRHRFAFRNSGRQLLVLLPPRTPCACSSAVVGAVRTKPGETGAIEVTVDTSTFEGEIEKEFGVGVAHYSGLGGKLRVRAIVRPEFVWSERVVSLGSREGDAGVEKVLVVTAAEGTDAEVLTLTSSDPSVDVRMQQAEGKGRDVRIIVAQRADAPVGSHFGNLTIYTSSPFMPEIRIPVRGRVDAQRRPSDWR